MDSSKKTNGQAAIDVLRTRGIETVSGFTFEMPDGLKVKVTDEEDVFLDKPYVAGTKITIFTSAKAGAFIRVGGEVWALHKNDLDPWPSDFHAHQGREVLDCYTGDIFNKTTRKFVRKIRRKDLARFISAIPDHLKQSK